MRIFNFIFGALLFGAAIYLSYWHTYDLLERGSYLSYSAHVGTFLGEGIFALGTINIFYSKIRQIEVRWFSAPRIALYAGVLIVGYSNISSGFGKGAEAIGIGVAIPILMLIAEAVVSHSLQSGLSEKQTLSETDSETDTQTADTFGQSDRQIRIVRTVRKKVSKRTDRRYFFNGQYLGQTIPDTSDSTEDADGHLGHLEPDTDHKDAQTVEDISLRTLGQTKTDSKNSSVRTKETDSNLNPDSLDKKKFRTVSDTSDNQTMKQTDTTLDTLIPDTSDSINRQTLQTENGQRTTRTKIANRINHLLDEGDTTEDIIDIDEHTYQAAIEYIKENGKRPSVRGLADLAGVKKNKAEKAIKRIKAEQIA